MADFCITAVRYNKAKEHIEFVAVREEKPGKVGHPCTVSRVFIADLIRLDKATFQTRIQDAEGLWQRGARVHVLEEIYLTTDRNSTKRDNLGNLPEF